MTVFSLKDVVEYDGPAMLPNPACLYHRGRRRVRVRISNRRVFEMADVRKLCKHFRVTLKTDRAEQAVTADAE